MHQFAINYAQCHQVIAPSWTYNVHQHVTSSHNTSCESLLAGFTKEIEILQLEKEDKSEMAGLGAGLCRLQVWVCAKDWVHARHG
jgi:hypothetical protein